jgi:predicted ATPase/DNA-binding XRE family transcriptional regulator
MTSAAHEAGAFRFGDWMRQLRRNRGETQDGLGQALGFSKETIRSVESRYVRPSRPFVAQVLQLLDVAPEKQAEFEKFARNGPVTPASLPGWITELAWPERTPLKSDSLPAPATRLIGRTREIESIRDRMREYGLRLCTLVGAPGVGKTRLAVAVAAELRADFADGVHFVSLSECTSVDNLLTAIASTLRTGNDSFAALKRELGDRHMLLVLDTLEHLASAGPMLTALLAAAPRLKLLVTSRHVLKVYGEHAITVSPLPLPKMSGTTPELLASPSVSLFVERARAVDCELVLNDQTASVIAQICNRVDGVPLALELAAARCGNLGLTAILKRLDDCLALLVDGPLDQPLRHRSLRNALDWSVALLSPAERRAFAHLAVFSGGLSREVAAAVLDDSSMLDALADKSLLSRLRLPDGTLCYRPLHVVREYARELLAADDLQQLRTRVLAA